MTAVVTAAVNAFVDHMPAIFRYFWFVCAAFMLVNVVIWRTRLQGMIDRSRASREEIESFTRWLAFWLVGAPLLLGIIGLSAGWSSPFCAGFLAFDSIPRVLASLVVLCAWGALLWWLWRGSGADFLARVGPALWQRPSYEKTYTPRLVRLVITGLVLISAIGSAIGWRVMPMPRELACPEDSAGTARIVAAN